MAGMSELYNKESIIIIGDWFIDENWLVAKHKTYSSSHTGDIHYLSKHKNIDRRMISLCGAPEIFEILRSYFKGSGKYGFFGYGVWNTYDDNIIQCTLCPKNTEKKHLTPYTIHSLKEVAFKNKKRLCPYKDKKSYCDYDQNLFNLASDTRASTNRIIRCYEGFSGGKPHLLYRFDWELPINKIKYSKFNDLKNKNIKAVIIEDHGKGVINDRSITRLIDVLGKKSEQIKWYIRTKIDEPIWYKKLIEKNINVRLIVIDYKIAFYIKKHRQWRFGKELGRSSLELLGELTGDDIFRHGEKIKARDKEIVLTSDRAAVLFDDNTAIAKDKQNCYNLYQPVGPKQFINIGRTTVFFAALIAQDLSFGDQNIDFGEQCSKALRCSFEWSKQASAAWNKEELHFYGDYTKALKLLEMPYGNSTEEAINYWCAWDEWNKSSDEYGIIEKTGHKKINVWMGEGAIKGYVCVGGPKRDAINDLQAKIAEFDEEKNPEHPFNCLLVSSPGWGKSYLAKCLANHFDMEYIEFSLAQMATTRDLINCFDTICSVQSSIEKKVLIFMDEINCEIEGHSAMGLLLSPIWDGLFIRDGKHYRVSPATWIFASTEPLEILIDSNKGSDFVSRLNGPVIILDALCTKGGEDILLKMKTIRSSLAKDPKFDPTTHSELQLLELISGQFRTEQVYLGVSLLNKYWGPISKIQLDVIKLFHGLLPVNGFRSLEFFISKFEYVKHGVVVPSNVPTTDNYPELKRHIVFSKEWREKKPKDISPNDPVQSGKFVEIVTIIQ